MVFCAIALAYTLLVFQNVHALATNRTIDDQNGDSVTGALPSYSPAVGWSQGSQCKTCAAQPNPQQVFDQTWHDNTLSIVGPEDDLSVTMSFNGTAVYAYCILDNNNTYTTFTNLTFSLDGEQVGSFSHGPDGSGSYVYNALVYTNTSVPNGNHTFVIHSPRGSVDSLVLFDYVQYTYDPDFPSAHTRSSHSNPNVGAIVGGTVGGVMALALIAGIILFLRWRRRRSSDVNTSPAIPFWQPPQSTDPHSDLTSLPRVSSTLLSPESQRRHHSSLLTGINRDLLQEDVPQQSGRYLSEKARRGEISRQLEERQQQLTALQTTSSLQSSPSSPSMAQSPVDTVHREHDTALESQVEELKQEVMRLREMMGVLGGEPPPRYYG